MIVYSIVGVYIYEGTTEVEIYPEVYTNVEKASNKLKEVIQREKSDSWIREEENISEDCIYNSKDILTGYSVTNEYEDSTEIFIKELNVCD